MLVVNLVATSGQIDQVNPNKSGEDKMQLSSPVFQEGGPIPVKYTCDDIDVSPRLVISSVPEGAKSLTLVCDDPDAPMGTWIHWIIFNLPPDLSELPKSIPREISLAFGKDSSVTALQGINDFKRIGYGGPCPPKGMAHRYYFRLYALDKMLEFNQDQITKGVTSDMLVNAMEGHILANSELMGKYKR
jgi:Raf kinase inhibitor-like YbhB/YbcL family protein